MSAGQTLVAHYVTTHPDEVARYVDGLAPATAASLLEALTPATAAMLVPRLAQERAARLLEGLSLDTAAAVVDRMDVDDAVSLVRRMDRESAHALLGKLDAGRAHAIDALFSHPPGTAGGVMDPDVLTIPLASTVAEARALLESTPGHLYYYLYVVDETQRLAGVFDLAELLQADPAVPVQSIVMPHVLWLSADAPLASVFAHPGWRTLDAMPVVGPGHRFLGVLRHRRMRQLRELADSSGGDDRTVRTMMALGEIYWLGLCGLLQGIAATASESPGEAR